MQYEEYLKEKKNVKNNISNANNYLQSEKEKIKIWITLLITSRDCYLS